MENESFVPNPFRMLNAEQYPDGEAANTPVCAPPEDFLDRELFLEAVHKLSLPPRKKRRAPVFTLGDILGDLKRSGPPAAKAGTSSMTSPEAKLAPVKKEKNIEQATTGEDNEIFLLAMRTATPLKGKGRKVAPRASLSSPQVRAEDSFEDMVASRFEFSLMYSEEYLEGRVTGLDEAIMNSLRSGRMSPEAHLDLHGLNAMQAYENLKFFLRDAWFKGLRVILLVPGRGRNSPNGMGILRQKLQGWLTQEPFKRIVLAFCTAQPVDGGPGSIYVLLRRFRKKGRIQWERLPADPDLY